MSVWCAAGARAKHFIYLPWPLGGARSWAVAATTLLIIWFARILEASDLSELHQLLGSAHVDLLGAGDPVSVSAKKCCTCFMLTPRSSSFSFVFIEACSSFKNLEKKVSFLVSVG